MINKFILTVFRKENMFKESTVRGKVFILAICIKKYVHILAFASIKKGSYITKFIAKNIFETGFMNNHIHRGRHHGQKVLL
jgi:hypothetical protein